VGRFGGVVGLAVGKGGLLWLVRAGLWRWGGLGLLWRIGICGCVGDGVSKFGGVAFLCGGVWGVFVVVSVSEV